MKAPRTPTTKTGSSASQGVEARSRSTFRDRYDADLLPDFYDEVRGALVANTFAPKLPGRRRVIEDNIAAKIPAKTPDK